MIPPKYPDDVQAQGGRVIPRENRILCDQLRFNLRQLLQDLDADIDKPVNVQRQLHQIEEESHVLLHRQIIRVPRGEPVQHLDHSDAALPRHDVLIEVTQVLTFLRGRLEVELVPGVLLHLAAFGDVHAELLREELADLLRHLLDGVPGLVPDLAHAVEEDVALVAVVLGERVVLGQRKVGRVQQMSGTTGNLLC